MTARDPATRWIRSTGTYSLGQYQLSAREIAKLKMMRYKTSTPSRLPWCYGGTQALRFSARSGLAIC